MKRIVVLIFCIGVCGCSDDDEELESGKMENEKIGDNISLELDVSNLMEEFNLIEEIKSTQSPDDRIDLISDLKRIPVLYE